MKPLICACVLFVVALGSGRAEDKGESKVDWEQAYRQLLKKHPEIRKKVESGGATKEQVLAWLKKKAATKVVKVDWEAAYRKALKEDPEIREKVESGQATKQDIIAWLKKEKGDSKSAKFDWEAAYEKALKEDPGLRKKVKSGQTTKQEVIAWLKDQGVNRSPKSANKSKSTKLNLKRFGEKLRALAKEGKLSPEEAKRLYVLAAGGNGSKGKRAAQGKGKSPKNKAGVTNFYAIVIGRLKSKDIELGEFSMEVDHVTSMYANRWVKEELVGKVVNVSGVSGKFLDQLLLLKRGETLKFRSGSYIAKSQTLKFGAKFHVLERAKPFDPAAYGVPPKNFRGFAGVLQGTIVETGGYEAMLRVERVVHTGEGNESQDANCIEGKLVRLTGFFRHQKKYNDLRLGDTIRVGARHANPTHDELGVTGVLEKVK